MTYLHQLASRDFIVLDAAQTVTNAVAAVHCLKPTRIIVRHWDNGNVYHYLYVSAAFGSSWPKLMVSSL